MTKLYGENKHSQEKASNWKITTGKEIKNGELKEESRRYKVKTEEPDYYNTNGLSPNGAFQQGLISKAEYIGCIKGNIIKYVVRCDKKGNGVEDIDKAIDYLNLLKKEL